MQRDLDKQETFLIFLYHCNVFEERELKDQITIGRTTGDIIVSADNNMSGKHAQISLNEEDGALVIYIEDLGSKNKTVVNRAEICAGQKIKLELNTLIETGAQQFILTDNPKLGIMDVNTFLNRFKSMQVKKLESIDIIHAVRKQETIETEEIVINEPVDELAGAEIKFTQIKKDLLALDINLGQELKKLEEMKEKLLLTSKTKKEELTLRGVAIKKELDEQKAKFQKLRAEVENKKKKVINLKDLPKLSETEEIDDLPEIPEE